LRYWIVHTIRLSIKIVSGSLVGSSPTATTYPFIFADTAFSLNVVKISQVIEQRRVGPNLAKRLLFDITGFNIEIATSLNYSLMRDKTEADTR
jgi:hypothetical protein